MTENADRVPKPDAATGLVAQAGLGPVDQRGVADELRRRLGAEPSRPQPRTPQPPLEPQAQLR